MLIKPLAIAWIAAALSLTPTVFAKESKTSSAAHKKATPTSHPKAAATPAVKGPLKVIPCALGSGAQGGCSYCANKTAVAVGTYDKPTVYKNFNLPNAAVKNGGTGYDVYFSIPQPDDGCRIFVTTPFNGVKGPIISYMSGNVVITTANAGCKYAHINYNGFAVGQCCGDDCVKVAAAPGVSQDPKSKRDDAPPAPPPSRIMRGVDSDVSKHEERSWGGVQAPVTPVQSAAPAHSCTAPTPFGGQYQRAGLQSIDQNMQSCNGGPSCDITQSLSVSVSTSLMSESSTSHSDSHGSSWSYSAGVFFMWGPTASVTYGTNSDVSDTISQSTSSTQTNSLTNTTSTTWALYPGPTFMLWFTPTYNCKLLNMTCDGTPVSVEKCDPQLEGGNAVGDHGIVTTG